MKKVLTYPGLNGFGAKRGERPLCARQQEKRSGAVRIRVMAAALILGCMSIRFSGGEGVRGGGSRQHGRGHLWRRGYFGSARRGLSDRTASLAGQTGH